MGKEFFEFLEEEYMGLTSQVQRGLKQQEQQRQQQQHQKQTNDGEEQKESNTNTTTADDEATVPIDLPLLFTRCHGIYQQMRVESRKNPEFKDRLILYSVQLTALLEHYQNSVFPPTTATANANDTVRRSMTTTDQMSKSNKTSSGIPPLSKAAPSSTMRQELTFTFTINDDDDDYDTSLM